MSKIFLIRHGQASFLEEEYDNLSGKGIEQSKALGNFFYENEVVFDKIFAGNLKRHQQTYKAYKEPFTNNGINLPEPIYLKELNEHQALEAFKLAFKEFVQTNSDAAKFYKEMKRKPNLRQKNYIKLFGLFFKEFVDGNYPLNGHPVQSWSDFRMQTKIGINAILKNSNAGETIGVFTSGGTKSAIIGDCLELKEQKILELNMAIRNSSFSQMRLSKTKLHVLSLNEIPHLSKELITFV